MQNKQPYQAQEFSERFRSTDLFQQISSDFDLISFSKFFQLEKDNLITPRQFMGDQSRQTTFSAVPFYYLEYLLEKNPREIYDLGCGWNIFKKYIPNVIGVSAEPQDSNLYYADIHDFVDDDYIRGHQNYFESVFSICALHFHPLDEFAKIVDDFYSMIKPGGRGFLSLNLMRMIDRGIMIGHNFMTKVPAQEYDKYCRAQLDSLSHINFLVVDVDFQIMNDPLDGNIRLVLEKEKQ